MLEQKKVRSKRTQFPLFPFIVSDGKRGEKSTHPTRSRVLSRGWIFSFLDESRHIFEEKVMHVLFVHVLELES